MNDIEFSPLGIEKYFCVPIIVCGHKVSNKRVCSVFEKNGQGWFFRTTNGNQIGELCDSEESANQKAIEYTKNFK